MAIISLFIEVFLCVIPNAVRNRLNIKLCITLLIQADLELNSLRDSSLRYTPFGMTHTWLVRQRPPRPIGHPSLLRRGKSINYQRLFAPLTKGSCPSGLRGGPLLIAYKNRVELTTLFHVACYMLHYFKPIPFTHLDLITSFDWSVKTSDFSIIDTDRTLLNESLDISLGFGAAKVVNS